MVNEGTIHPTPGDRPKLHDKAGTIVEDGCYVQYTPDGDTIPVIGLISDTNVFADTVTVNYPNTDGTSEEDDSVQPETATLVVQNADGTLVTPS